MWEREEVVKGRKRENRKKSEQIKEVGEKNENFILANFRCKTMNFKKLKKIQRLEEV